MRSPYLIEVRTTEDTKQKLRDIIHDVADEFDVRAAAEPRAVPHITLFGPYNTDKGHEVKSTLLDVFERYDVVPYKIDGFDHFREDVIYAKVVPSQELRQLRRELLRGLRPITYNYPDHDEDFYYEFHITIAFKDIGEKFDDILGYLEREYTIQSNEYVTRIANLEGRRMMYEYDVLRDEVLSQKQATSREFWRMTEAALNERATAKDHVDEVLAPKPESALTRYKEVVRSRRRCSDKE